MDRKAAVFCLALAELSLLAVLGSCQAKVVSTECEPTVDDGVSPSYRPEAPVHSRVGLGHRLTGVIRSSADCRPIAGAKIELWPEYAGRGHPDTARATVLADDDGTYWFECDPPEHIHIRVSAPGFVTIRQNGYHPGGKTFCSLDLVLLPQSATRTN